MIESVHHIYFRGLLCSCNYACTYCPFAKKTFDEAEIKKDCDAVERFCNFVEGTVFKNKISILFTPYGEALIHEHYVKAIARLALNPKIQYIACQTNLSFDEVHFINTLQCSNVPLEKVKLWASFHPEMVCLDKFIGKVERLKKYIDLSVGIVAIPQDLQPTFQLKRALPKDIYMWINGKSREKTRYTKSQISELIKIDPLFHKELQKNRVEENCCVAGSDKVFIKANGDVFPCSINKNRLSNIYKNRNSFEHFRCDRKYCDCYLAYSNRKDFNCEQYFGNYVPIRIPYKKEIEAIFLDVDGTLTTESGVIDKKAIEHIKFLKEKAKIYLATSLPLEIAIKRCKTIKTFISGGVFANGGQIVDWDLKYSEIVSLEKETADIVKNIPKLKIYKEEDSIYKILTLKKYIPSQLESNSMLKLTYEKGLTSIQPKRSSKLNGILKICSLNGFNQDKVLVMGNSINDLEMITYFKHSVAVIDAKPDVIKKSARYNYNIDHLAMFT